MTNKQTHRLDQYLVTSGFFSSRSRAGDAVSRGVVFVNGTPVTKAGASVSESDTISVNDPAQSYVSRAALKLKGGLEHFGLSPDGLHCLDIGASTGGFAQVLLEAGAAHVTAIDVGHGQMHPQIANDPRVTNIEGVNARYLTRSDIGERPVGAVVSDVSFISLTLALPPALVLAASGAFCILLVKPQFEAGKEAIGKGGILKDKALGAEIADRMAEWLNGIEGWASIGVTRSPISGGDGNEEYLLAGRKS